MNLYSLLQLSFANIASDLGLGALVLSAIGILGKVWVPHLGFFSRVVIGASFIAAIVSGIVGINAKFGHYFMNVSNRYLSSCRIPEPHSKNSSEKSLF